MWRPLAALVLVLAACKHRGEPVVAADRTTIPITIETSFPGAAASEVASAITTPLERQLGYLPQLERLRSESTLGHSTIVAEFASGAGTDTATAEVFHALAAARDLLPRELPAPPVVRKVARTGAVLRLVLQSDTVALAEVARLASTFEQKLAQVAGVGEVEVCGAAEEQLRVEVDPLALAATGKTIDDVATEVREGNVANRPIAELPLVRQVAKVEAGEAPRTCRAFDALHQTIAITVSPQPGVEPLALRERLEALLPTLGATVPQAVHLVTWPRTRPLAFEVRFERALAPLERVRLLQAALAELPPAAHVLAQQGRGAHGPDADAADLRIVPREGEDAAQLAATIRTRLVAHGLVLRDRTDHVVGLVADDPALLHTQLAALVTALARASTLHVVEQLGADEADAPTLTIDEDTRARLGVPREQLDALRALAPEGLIAGTEFTQLDQRPIVITVPGELVDNLSRVHVRSTTGALIPLSTFLTATRTREPSTILHDGQFPWVGVRVAGPLDDLSAALATVPVPAATRRDVHEPD